MNGIYKNTVQHGLYEKEIEVVKEIVKEFSDKGKLKKSPKVSVSKDVRLAAVKGFKNELSVGEYLLVQFQKGAFSLDDVKSSIAHEVGHLMPSKLPWYHRIFKYVKVTMLYMALMVAIFFGFFFVFPATLLPFTIALIASIPFLPWAIRKIERPFELEADRNAVTLIGSDALAKSIINKSAQWHEYNLGPLETLEELEDRLSHPSLSERLEKIGFRLRLQIEK